MKEIHKRKFWRNWYFQIKKIRKTWKPHNTILITSGFQFSSIRKQLSVRLSLKVSGIGCIGSLRDDLVSMFESHWQDLLNAKGNHDLTLQVPLSLKRSDFTHVNNDAKHDLDQAKLEALKLHHQGNFDLSRIQGNFSYHDDDTVDQVFTQADQNPLFKSRMDNFRIKDFHFELEHWMHSCSFLGGQINPFVLPKIFTFHDIKKDKDGDGKTRKMREVLVASINGGNPWCTWQFPEVWMNTEDNAQVGMKVVAQNHLQSHRNDFKEIINEEEEFDDLFGDVKRKKRQRIYRAEGNVWPMYILHFKHAFKKT